MDGLSRLEAARQQLHESEESAQDTMMHLQAQREVLQRARDNVRVGGRWAGLVVLRGTCRVVDIVWWFGALGRGPVRVSCFHCVQCSGGCTAQAKEVNRELDVSDNFLNRMSKWWRG